MAPVEKTLSTEGGELTELAPSHNSYGRPPDSVNVLVGENLVDATESLRVIHSLHQALQAERDALAVEKEDSEFWFNLAALDFDATHHLLVIRARRLGKAEGALEEVEPAVSFVAVKRFSVSNMRDFFDQTRFVQ